ncbi:hypothetical protein H4582DRAFT_1934194 [Lactarius indigo]|nr:hypothetical protein H4582DRAFT_1934194 [Lactarius indigo]
MQQPPNAEARTRTPLTPPAATRGFLSFAWAQGQAAQSKRESSSSPPLDFDAGINASNAWTVYLDSDSSRSRSLSDEAEDEAGDDFEGDIDGRGGRVLFAFTGKPEFRELDVTVLREQAGDGWSLVKTRQGRVGLLPRSYFTFTVDFISAPEAGTTLHARHISQGRRRDASTASLTPRGSPTHTSSPLPPAKPIVIQTTGERMMAAFPSFRQGLLGGKSLNRFSSFVTSGAEAYVLNGASAPNSDVPPPSIKHVFEGSDDEDDRTNPGRAGAAGATHSSEADKHFVDAGPSWRQKVPPFRVLVHSPSKRTSALSGAYTVYSVSSIFRLQTPEGSETESADSVNSSPNASRITVHRRFSHFVVLHTSLTRRLPGLALPPLPEKQYAGRFNDDFVEARRCDLERYLAMIVRHPVARYAEILTFFLSCESEQEWKRQLPHYVGLPPAGPSFYANVFHPDFNFDPEEAAETVNRFEVHTRAVDTGVQGLRNVFTQIRQARVEMSKAERLLSYSLLSLITTKPIATLPNAGVTTQEEDIYSQSDLAEIAAIEEDKPAKKVNGYVNEQGAWCWREGCEGTLFLTTMLLCASQSPRRLSEAYEGDAEDKRITTERRGLARRTQLATHEALKNIAHPSQLYAPVVDTHRNALSRYTDATEGSKPNEEIASRCETVEDFASIAKEHLDGEIEFYEQPSIYERDLERPRLDPDPLPQPCPHVFDSAPMRPVSHAIQEGVGLLLGSATNVVTGRGSMFGKFW